MLISLFLISLLTLELILRHDEKVSRREIQQAPPQTAKPEEVTGGLLALSHQLENQGRGVQPALDRQEQSLEPVHAHVEVKAAI